MILDKRLVILFYASFIIAFSPFCLAIYFLYSKDYSSLTLITSAIIFLSCIIYHVAKSSGRNVFRKIFDFSLPFGLLDFLFPFYLFTAIGLIMNYLSVFAIVNTAYKILKMIFIS